MSLWPYGPRQIKALSREMLTDSSFNSCDMQTVQTNIYQSDGAVSSSVCLRKRFWKPRRGHLDLWGFSNWNFQSLPFSKSRKITVNLCCICGKPLMSPHTWWSIFFPPKQQTAHTDLSTTTRYLQGVSSGLGPAALLPQLHHREWDKGR